MLDLQTSMTDRDFGAEELLEQLKLVNSAYVEAGLFDGEQHPAGGELTVAQIGAVNEFGSADGHIPARPWLSRAIREQGERWEAKKARALGDVSEGKASVFDALSAFGEKVASDIRLTINKVMSPPKAESTMRREGGPLKRTKGGKVAKGAREKQLRFSHPLIWTGTMRACVRSRIVLSNGSRKMTPKGK